LTALSPGTSFATTVTLHGAQNLGFGGNGTMPGIAIVLSTNTGFTFQFFDYSGGGALTPTPATLNIDYITIPTTTTQ
jgi:hypothetical protein